MLMVDATTGINPFKFIAATRSFQLDKKLDGVAKGVVATPNGAKASADTPSTGSAVAVAAKPKSKAKPIPAELMSRFVRLIHGATEAKPQLRDKIHAAFTGEKGVSKAGIDVSFQQVGSKKGKDGVWFIEESVLVSLRSTLVPMPSLMVPCAGSLSPRRRRQNGNRLESSRFRPHPFNFSLDRRCINSYAL